jgi:hypothetical protein
VLNDQGITTVSAEGAQISQIQPTDIPQVATFLERHRRPTDTPATGPLDPEQRLRWLLLENPARADDIPLGWCIRDADSRVSGAMLCVPLHLAGPGFDGRALMSCKFFVDEPHRGLGIGLFMRFLKLGQRFPLLATSANAASGALFAQFGGYAIPGTEHTMLGVRRPAPLAEEWLHRRTHRPALARFLSTPARFAPSRMKIRPGDDAGAELIPIVQPDDLASLHLPSPAGALAVVRDQEWLCWRYFSPDHAAHDLFRFHCNGEDRLLVTNVIESGYRGQIRVLNVLDLWPPLDPRSVRALPPLLQKSCKDRFDALWLRGQPQDVEQVLRTAGFIGHDFPAPLGCCIDRAALLPTRNWYLMPAESE